MKTIQDDIKAIEDYWKKYNEAMKIYTESKMLLQNYALRYAFQLKLSADAIGKTPEEWYYFALGAAELIKRA